MGRSARRIGFPSGRAVPHQPSIAVRDHHPVDSAMSPDELPPVLGGPSLLSQASIVLALAVITWLVISRRRSDRAQVRGGTAVAAAIGLFHDPDGEGERRGLPLASITICHRGTIDGWHVELVRGWLGSFSRGGPVWLGASDIIPPLDAEPAICSLPDELATRVQSFLADPFASIRRDRVTRPVRGLERGDAATGRAALAEIAALARDLGRWAETGNAFSIHLGFRSLRYREGRLDLEVAVEPLADGTMVVSIPAADAWAREVPDWARDHRERIVARLRRHLDACGRWQEA
jgi:hypothetical protein